MSDVAIRAPYPFKPLNGYMVISEDPGNARPALGNVWAVCESLADQIKVGDRVLYKSGYGEPISFGEYRGLLINVKEIYGIWDLDRVDSIFNARSEMVGLGNGRKVVQAIEFV